MRRCIPSSGRIVARLLLLVAATVLVWTAAHRDAATQQNAIGKSELGEDRPKVLSRHPSGQELLDLPHFAYLVNNDACGGRNVFLLTLVHSAVDHSELRETIRQTWASAGPNLALQLVTVFLVASPRNSSVQASLEAENARNRDLVQGSFVDSYRNLTYKHVMGLRWAASACSGARFLLKLDDDIFVNIFGLVRLLLSLRKDLADGRTLVCRLQRAMPVVRDPSSKWFVSKREHPDDAFEEYCSGWAYLGTPAAAESLTRAAQRLPFFWVDDAHVTGPCARTAGVRRRPLPSSAYTLESRSLAEWARAPGREHWDHLFAPTWGDSALFLEAHRKAQRCFFEGCTAPTSKPTTPTPLPPTGKGVARLLPSNRFKFVPRPVHLNKGTTLNDGLFGR